MPGIISTPASAKGFLLDGRWINNGAVAEIRSPYDQSIVGAAAVATRAHAEQAIAAAVRTFETTRRLPAFERQRILREIAQGIAQRHEEFARSICLEAGKPIKTARAEVDRAAFTFTVAAEEAGRIGGEYLPMDLQASTTGRWGMVLRFPIGAIAAITPFNFPLNLVAHKGAPAIACGCTLVL